MGSWSFCCLGSRGRGEETTGAREGSTGGGITSSVDEGRQSIQRQATSLVLQHPLPARIHLDRRQGTEWGGTAPQQDEKPVPGVGLPPAAQQQMAAAVARAVEAAVARVEAAVGGLKGDLAREMGYPLAMRLIQEVSAVFDPNVERVSLRNQPSPWGWLHRHYDFKKALHDHSESLPLSGLKSVDAIADTASHVMAHSHRKFHKSHPEKLYAELKSFKDKGYMECLKVTDLDLYNFLDLSSFFAMAFIARPRLLQLTSFMMHRVRNELSIYWHTWDKLPFSWDQRWHEAEDWFKAVVDCFKLASAAAPDSPPLPTIMIEVAREFDSIEEASRRIHGVNRDRDVGSFDEILKQYKDFKECGLLSPEVRKQQFLCCTFLELSLDIKKRYMEIVEKKRQNGDEAQREHSTRSSNPSLRKRREDSNSTQSTSRPSIFIQDEF